MKQFLRNLFISFWNNMLIIFENKRMLESCEINLSFKYFKYLIKKFTVYLKRNRTLFFFQSFDEKK